MTTPLNDPTPESQRRNWLLRYIGVQEKYDHEISTALQDAAQAASSGILDRLGDYRIGSSTRRYQLGLAAQAARAVLQSLFRGRIYPAIQNGQSAAAVAAVEAGFVEDRRVLPLLFPDSKRRADYEESMRQSASRGVQAMMTRILVSKIPLSQQVYRTEALASGQVDRIINSSLATGDSAADIAKKVRSSIDPSTPGGVAYAAKRLGRTEINNAFHAQSIADIEDKPWVDDVNWNLSKVHVPQGCKCEEYAAIRVFSKDAIPDKPHPQCMCYTTPNATNFDDFKANLLAGIYDDYIDTHL